MSDLDQPVNPSVFPRQRRRRHRNFLEALQQSQTFGARPLVDVGQRLRDLRNERGLSMRALAEKSQLNINTKYHFAVSRHELHTHHGSDQI